MKQFGNRIHIQRSKKLRKISLALMFFLIIELKLSIFFKLSLTYYLQIIIIYLYINLLALNYRDANLIFGREKI